MVSQADLPLTDFETVLTTTRSVRRRLDYTRPIPRSTVMECLGLAIQAPTGGDAEDWRFVLIGDRTVRAQIAAIYRRCYDEHVAAPIAARSAAHTQGRLRGEDDATTSRMLDGARELAEGIGSAPWLVLACATRPNPALNPAAVGNVAAVYGSIFPAVWSFQLALRSRGLGSVITTLHLHEAGEVAQLLAIPDGVTQACLLPVAHTVGLDFARARRHPVEQVVYADRWGARA